MLISSLKSFKCCWASAKTAPFLYLKKWLIDWKGFLARAIIVKWTFWLVIIGRLTLDPTASHHLIPTKHPNLDHYHFNSSLICSSAASYWLKGRYTHFSHCLWFSRPILIPNRNIFCLLCAFFPSAKDGLLHQVLVLRIIGILIYLLICRWYCYKKRGVFRALKN